MEKRVSEEVFTTNPDTLFMYLICSFCRAGRGACVPENRQRMSSGMLALRNFSSRASMA